MNFNIPTEVELAVSLVVHFHSCDDLVQGVDFRYPSLPRGNCIPPKGYKVNELDDNPTGTFLEGERCNRTSHSLFGNMDLTLNLPYPYMFSDCYKVTCDSVGHNGFYMFKLHIK